MPPPSVELTRSNLVTTNSTDLYSSQTLLLDNILEDMPYNSNNSMVAQSADSKVWKACAAELMSDVSDIKALRTKWNAQLVLVLHLSYTVIIC